MCHRRVQAFHRQPTVDQDNDWESLECILQAPGSINHFPISLRSTLEWTSNNSVIMRSTLDFGV